MKNNNLVAYAIDFVSFLIQKTKYRDKVKNIILFGSVARQEETEKSDIDLFIDIAQDKNLEEEIEKIKEQFINSVKYQGYWKLLNVRNEIKMQVGQMEKWKELEPSLISNGIVIYGKYKPRVHSEKHRVFYIWENIRPNAKRVLLNKQMFGYTQNKKRYLGILEIYNGERLGKGCITVPAEDANPFHRLFKKHKIAVKIKKVAEY